MNYKKSLESTEIISSSGNIIEGYYGSDTVDLDGHIVFKEDYIAKMVEFLEWGNIRLNHLTPVGKLVQYNPSVNWNLFSVQIHDKDVMDKARNGVYKGFSIGIRAEESGLVRIPLSQIPEEKYSHLPSAVIKKIKRMGYVIRIKDFYIAEISLTDRPKNTKSVITFVKSESENDEELDEIPKLGEIEMEETNIVQNVSEGVDVENTEQDVEDVKSIVTDEAEEINKSVESGTESAEQEENIGNIVETEPTSVVTVEKSDSKVDSESAFQKLEKSLETLENSLRHEMSVLADSLKSLGEKLNKEEVVVDEDPATELSKSEPMDNETTSTSGFDIELLKSLIKDTISESFRSFETSEERHGTINKGEAEPQVQIFDTKKMEKGEAYRTIAGIIAKQVKK